MMIIRFSFRYIEHYSKWLPPNHHYICDVELTLTQAIGAGDSRNLQLISDKQLQKKIDLCEKLLRVFNILAAGICINFILNQSNNVFFFFLITLILISCNWISVAESRCLGALHFELHAALAELGRRGMQCKDNCFRKAIEDSLYNAEQTVRYLQHEPAELSEGQICAQTKTNIDSLKMIVASTAAPDI